MPHEMLFPGYKDPPQKSVKGKVGVPVRNRRMSKNAALLSVSGND